MLTADSTNPTGTTMAMNPGLNDEITVSPADPNGNDQPANGTSANKAVIRYAQYETDPGATVDLTLSGANCHFEDGTTNMNKVPLNNGSATIPFYSTTSSYVALTAYLTSNHRKYGSFDFHFAQAVKTVDLEVAPGYDTAPPDGSTADKVTATVYGYDGKGVAHIAVTFQLTPDATLIPAQPENTKPDGTATVSITNTVAGDVQVTAVAGGVKCEKPVTVHFGNSGLGVKAVDLQVVPQQAPADGVTQVRATATVAMSDGSKAPDGMPVKFGASNGATCYPAKPTISGGSGQATTWITSGTAGPSIVSASAGDVSSRQVTVNFTEASPAGMLVALNIVPAIVPADGKSAAQATAIVTKGDGSPAPDGTTVLFTLTNGAMADPPTRSVSGGQAMTRIVSTAIGSSSVTATELTGGAESDPVPVQFISPPRIHEFVITEWAVPADGKTPAHAKALILTSDGSSDAPDGTPVTFTATNGVKITPEMAYTAGGWAIASLTNDTVGTSRVTATVGQVTSNPSTVSFSAYAFAVTSLTPDGVPANGVSQNGCRVVVSKRDGSPLDQGASVRVAFTLANDTLGELTAKFDLTKPFGIQGDYHYVTVPTLWKDGEAVAEAWFTDTVAQGITVGVVVDLMLGQQHFTFTPA
jgi:adhesin/invasin